jgi:alkaline phosphatase
LTNFHAIELRLALRLILLPALASLLSSSCSFTPPAGSTPNIILIIGDGMQLEHEIAASRCLYGTDDGLSWHDFPEQLYVASWDVTTYDV